MTDADKHAFADAFARLAIAHREKHPDAVTMRTYFDGLQGFEIELVAAAADRLMRREWFPKLAQWHDAAETIARERRDQQRAVLRKLPAPLCPACDDTGWIRGDDNRVRRCPCVEQRRLELLGRATLELPGEST